MQLKDTFENNIWEKGAPFETPFGKDKIRNLGFVKIKNQEHKAVYGRRTKVERSTRAKPLAGTQSNSTV